jgi:LuxR family transcriptional regulator, maltose regulon positive regulatory protein
VEATLLATKTMIPPARPRLVPRPRLVERLEEGLAYDLILVSAPAGFGKTTLVGEWAREKRPQVHTCWLSLDEGDSDPVRFFEYLIRALQDFRPGLGEKILTWLHAPQPPPARSVLTALMNDLVGLSEDLVLVLDDFQFVTSADVHEAVSYLLEHLLPRLHLLLATRADPPLPLARLRGRGQLLEIGADDLRFTSEETAELIRELRGAPLTAGQVETLTRRTEGWAVGLKMAALSMGEAKDVSAFVDSFTGSQRYITDYLIEEVLEQQPAEIRDFLLRTSVLERLTAPLCDAVSGRTDSDALLPALERANLLLVPLDESRQWYRYEHLFSDLLRHQLTRVAGEEAVADLHRRASAWYKAHGFPREAIDHALAARDWEEAADLLVEFAERYANAGEVSTLSAWFEVLPEEVLLTRPPLCCTRLFALVLPGRLDEADALLDHMESMWGEDPVQHARITACRAEFAGLRGDVVRSIELAQTALPLLPASDAETRGPLSMALGMTYWGLGRLEQAEPLLQDGYRLATEAGDTHTAMTSLVLLAYIARSRGNLSHALDLGQQALALARGSPVGAGAHAGLVWILYERNELESALTHATMGLNLNRLLGDKTVQLLLLVLRTWIAIASGDETGARQATEQCDRFGAWEPSVQASYRMQLGLRRGDLDETSRWGDRLMRLDGEMPLGFVDRVNLIRVLGILGRKEELSQQIERMYGVAGIEPLAPEWKGWLIWVRTAQALAAPDSDEAPGFLAQALRVGEPEGWTRSFVDMGPRLAPLLRRAVSQGICPDYAAKLLTIIEVEERRRAQAGRSPRSSPIYTLLTERELEVLRLVGAGMSNRQIAARLFVSDGTVKTHLHNISEKLNATGRAGAYARAKELRLL